MSKAGQAIAAVLQWGWVNRAILTPKRWQEYEKGHIFSEEGELYMGRWNVVPRGSWRGKALSLLTGGEYNHIRLHWIRQPDRDRELHDHPFAYRTFVVHGWYEEQYIPSTILTASQLRAFQGSSGRLEVKHSFYRRRAVVQGGSVRAEEGQFHRIARVSLGGVWTLFCTGPQNEGSKWGFLVDGRWVKSSKFFTMRGINHDGTKVAATS